MMEITQDGETISDIHNYLNSFNKEIQSNPSAKEVTQVFLDDAGQYYYHTVNGEDMVIVDQVDKSEIETDCISIKSIKRSISPIQADNPIEINSPDVKDGILSHSGPRIGDHGQQTLQVLPVVDQREGGSQVILNSGDNNQIVTLVPSSTNPGEVSYVLIVEQTGDGDKGDAIYDFNEGDEGLTYINTKEAGEEESKKLVRIVPKKSQTIAPVHMCNYCNYTNPKRYLLLRHMKSHSEERPHKCSVCERGFKTLASLQNHVNTHTGIKPHRCKSCASTFTTSGELVRHVRYIHTHEKPHKCPDCDYASVEFSKLKRHMRCHTGERPYQCPHCTYASPDTFKLKRHLRIHTGEKPYECDICNSRFTQSNSLKAHKMIHTGNKPIYTCELCPTTCGRKTDLRIHIQKLHTSDKPLKCKKCAQTFPDRYTFKQHNKLHDGEKCFKCDLCAYASATLRHLESHMLVHTEQKPFKCKFCDQAFRQKQLLKRHENLYHDPFYIPPIPKEKIHKCHECCKTFRHKGNLLRHMSLHNPEDPLQEELQSGRDCRKRFDVINGVEVYSGSVEDQEMMTVEGQDGNQYVVLEVIQLQDNEDTVMMSDGIAVHDASLGSSDVLSSSPLFGSDSLNGDGTINGHGLLEIPDGAKKSYKIEHQDPKKEAQREMASCFGFDDEDDPSVMGLPFGE